MEIKIVGSIQDIGNASEEIVNVKVVGNKIFAVNKDGSLVPFYSIFGLNATYGISEPQQPVTAILPAQDVLFTCPLVLSEDGIYRGSVYMEIGYTSTNRSLSFDFCIDGVPVAHLFKESKNRDDVYQFNGFDWTALDAGEHTFEIKGAKEDGLGDAFVQNIKFEFWRIS